MKKMIKTIKKIIGIIAMISAVAGIIAFFRERADEKDAATQKEENNDDRISRHQPGFYERYIKRPLDCALSTGALIVLSPLMAVTAILVRTKLGSPILFTQERPGKDEKLFKLYKFRTMTDARDKDGNLLPDEVRLTKFGKALRTTSLDELPELINIAKGDMAIVGPRPQLVRDMVFMTDRERKRHTVRQGLTGLAQINGRNNISWEEKLEWDLEYIRNISFYNDVKIIFATVSKVLGMENTIREGTVSDLDFGDYLLKKNKLTKEEYDEKQMEAKKLLS